MIRRLLVDYGEVISTPLPEDTITDLAALADQPRAIFLGRYWQHRPAYDLGQPPAEYWPEVLARDLSRSPQVVDRLTDTAPAAPLPERSRAAETATRADRS
jgi:hypothetical protein